MTVTLTVDAITLAKGAHESCEDGTCLFEAYNLLVRHVMTDECPPEVSPVLHSYGMMLNDRFGDENRQQLKRFLPQPDGSDVLAGTAGDGLDEQRGYLALDWLIRTYTPAWLDLAGLTAEAAELRALRRIVDLAAVQSAGPLVRSAREKAAAAGAAAWAAARAAAGDAAWDAAWAAGDAAWAAGDAAWAAARAAAGDAAWAAGDAAWAAARAAARDAARDAAGERLAPTLDWLQDSAIDLFDRLIDPPKDAA